MELAEQNMALVPWVVRRYFSHRGQFDQDFLQAGYEGLMHAASLYRPERGFTFSTYATPWIRQAVQREMHRAESPRMSDRKADMARSVFPVEDALIQKLGRMPSVEEVSMAAGVDVMTLQAPRLIALGGDLEFADEGEPSPHLAKEEYGYLGVELEESLGGLSDQDQDLARLFAAGFTKAEVARMYGVSPTTISNRAIALGELLRDTL